MSDTVKLIIEIDNVTYNDIKKGKIYSSFRDVPLESVNAIANGTPLDDLKAEIGKAQEPYMTSTAYDEGVRFGLKLAYQIVDKYKAESEDT